MTPWPHRWLPGMAWRATAAGGQALSCQQGRVANGFVAPPDACPDIDDGPTKGGLLQLAREKHGPSCQVSPLVTMRGGEVTGWTWYLNDVDNPDGETKGGVYESEGLAHVGLLEWSP